MQYSVDYFINKFEAIPDDIWFVGYYHNDEETKFCALGHCKEHLFNSCQEESDALRLLFRNHLEMPVSRVNDGQIGNYQQPTPKQRILAALYDIKKLQQPSYPDITKELAVLNEFKEVDVVQKPVKTF